MDNLFKAVEKTQTSLNITMGNLVPVTADLYHDVLEVIKECFIQDEPIGNALGVEWTKEFEAFWVATMKANLSFVLIHEGSGEIMGFRLIRRIFRDANETPPDLSKVEDNAFREIMRMMQVGSKNAQFFEKYPASEAFVFLGLGVPKKYRQRGIATLMMKAGLKFCEHLGFDSFYVRGQGSSNYSKSIYEQLGFETLYEIKYDTYTNEDGEFLLRGKTGVHNSMKEYVLCVKSGTQT